MSATVLPPEPAPPQVVHNCPSCSHWLPDGTLACPDCHTLAYGSHLATLAAEAQALEGEGKWPEALDRWRSTLRFLPQETRQAQSILQHIAQLEVRQRTQEDNRAKWSKRLGPLAPVLLFLAKFKTAFFLLFKLKFFLGIFSFFGIYWLLYGWKFALGFTVCIFIHEMGHYVEVKRRGMKAELPLFLPGFAYVQWYSFGVSREVLADIALAGPLYGLIAALGCLLLLFITHHPLWLVLANVGAWINLLNLLPVFWLDGAKAAYALSRMQRALIAATCFIFFALTWAGAGSERTHWIFAIVGGGMVWRCFTNDVPEEAGIKSFILFQVLVIALGLLLCLTPLGGLS